MRGLVALTIIMGVVLVAGTGLLGVIIFHRLAVPLAPLPPLSLDEPVGTHIAGMVSLGDRLALRLEGGGVDRVVVVDLAHGRIVGRIGLAH
jgi:hypothetical protein